MQANLEQLMRRGVVAQKNCGVLLHLRNELFYSED